MAGGTQWGQRHGPPRIDLLPGSWWSSGPETASQTTTTDGCAFFPYLEPETYTATFSTTGYVDRQGNQPATQTVGVTATQISKVQFDYDKAATLSVGLTTPTGAVIPSGIALTVANSNLTVGTKSFQQSSTGSGTTRTVTPLFPYASGYQVWAGDCADADPAAYTGGSRGAVLASDPAGTTSGSVNLDAVDVVVKRGGVAVSGAIIQASHAAGTGCTAGETLTTPTATAPNVTDSTGKLRLALPYGTWTIRATSGSRTATGSVTLDPVTATVPTLNVVLP